MIIRKHVEEWHGVIERILELLFVRKKAVYLKLFAWVQNLFEVNLATIGDASRVNRKGTLRKRSKLDAVHRVCVDTYSVRFEVVVEHQRTLRG